MGKKATIGAQTAIEPGLSNLRKKLSVDLRLHPLV